jgi:myb proto-oncogene protein
VVQPRGPGEAPLSDPPPAQGKVGNKWSEIAKHIPGRTGQQCAQRWRHKVRGATSRFFLEHQCNDAPLLFRVPNRLRHHAAQAPCMVCPCRFRSQPQVNPNIRRDKWTDEEDSHLVDLVKTFGIGKWAEIARHMVGRTDQQCMGRWRRHLDPSIRRVRSAGPRCLGGAGS